MPTGQQIWSLLKTLLFAATVIATVTVYIPYRTMLGSSAEFLPQPAPSLEWIGFTIVGFGAIVALLCLWDFAYSGLGTPAPFDPPKFLVRKRWYGIMRNPMYVGVFLVQCGEAFLFRPFAWMLLRNAAIFAILVHLFVVFYEEPHLRHKFGADYEAFCQQVPRWIPRMRLSR